MHTNVFRHEWEQVGMDRHRTSYTSSYCLQWTTLLILEVLAFSNFSSEGYWWNWWNCLSTWIQPHKQSITRISFTWNIIIPYLITWILSLGNEGPGPYTESYSDEWAIMSFRNLLSSPVSFIILTVPLWGMLW